MHYRSATSADVPAIAALHAASWQRTYRGAFSDTYLDEQAPAERLATWRERFAVPNPRMIVTVAEDDTGLQGFCCVFMDHDQDGHLLDNLHVSPAYQGQGIGKRLMQRSAARVAEHAPGGDIYLWVLTVNTPALRVYESLGGRPGRTEVQHFAAGNQTPALQMIWRLADMAAFT
ncbi:GNAT family N-acetyltransferase [Neolewinella lacunae]|uniref:GNAT family N-acetyltransferase n=1 Tax=Neolewinella lacunae TaxID=1517758 RepID=A0A923TAT3_9BACT|nr:GNAT family N-acetyltransferase [Neolewinella lacunae]MBC6996821.1 GNAT family N-acetyltransferase [Neolewinella lacunae]MDN3633799.1 GNAT family N-acetyltransferase [Neolewinella lacunae]